MIDKFVKKYYSRSFYRLYPKSGVRLFRSPNRNVKIKTRKRQVVQARQIAMYFAKNMTKSSLSSIGAHCGKDHATVLHACRTVNNLIETDKKFKASVLLNCKKKISINGK